MNTFANGRPMRARNDRCKRAAHLNQTDSETNLVASIFMICKLDNNGTTRI
jgi:hypothetical protein